MIRNPEQLNVPCPFCDSHDVEVQICSRTKDTYYCNECSRIFVVDKATGKVGQPRG